MCHLTQTIVSFGYEHHLESIDRNDRLICNRKLPRQNRYIDSYSLTTIKQILLFTYDHRIERPDIQIFLVVKEDSVMDVINNIVYFLFLFSVQCAYSLNNGLGRTPQMGKYFWLMMTFLIDDPPDRFHDLRME